MIDNVKMRETSNGVKKYRNLFIMILLLSPVIVSAQLSGIKDLIQAVGDLINPLIRIMVGAALLVFFWGLVKFIFHVGGDEKAVDEGKRVMKWGLIALFVMLSVWGIIKFAQKALIPGGSLSPSSGFPWVVNT